MSRMLHDNLDDRREVYKQIHSIHPGKRLKFLSKMCRLAGGVRPSRDMAGKVAKAVKSDFYDEMLSAEIYANLWLLTQQYSLPESVLVRETELVARSGG